MNNFFAMFKTKTVWAALIGAAAYVVQSDIHNPMTWVNAVTGLFGAVSVRSAIDKSAGGVTGNTVADPTK